MSEIGVGNDNVMGKILDDMEDQSGIGLLPDLKQTANICSFEVSHHIQRSVYDFVKIWLGIY